MLLAATSGGLRTLDELDAHAGEDRVVAATAPPARARKTPPPATGSGDLVPNQPIGVGKPLTVRLERVYPGDFPDAMPHVPGRQDGDVLVTSAHKNDTEGGQAPRAIHLLKERPARRQFLEPAATEQGSMLAYYSPGVTDESLLFTFEMSLSHQFANDVAPALAKAFTTAGALPVFAPVSPYLVAAGVAIPIVDAAVKLLQEPLEFFSASVEINLGRPGMRRFTPGHLVVTAHGTPPDAFTGYTLTDSGLVDAKGRQYDGEHAYIVISLDGTERPDLKNWSQQAASAAIVNRFFGGSETLTGALPVVSDALSVASDLTYQRKALDASAALAAATDADEKARLKALLDGYRKNISNDAIRATVTG